MVLADAVFMGDMMRAVQYGVCRTLDRNRVSGKGLLLRRLPAQGSRAGLAMPMNEVCQHSAAKHQTAGTRHRRWTSRRDSREQGGGLHGAQIERQSGGLPAPESKV